MDRTREGYQSQTWGRPNPQPLTPAPATHLPAVATQDGLQAAQSQRKRSTGPCSVPRGRSQRTGPLPQPCC